MPLFTIIAMLYRFSQINHEKDYPLLVNALNHASSRFVVDYHNVTNGLTVRLNVLPLVGLNCSIASKYQLRNDNLNHQWRGKHLDFVNRNCPLMRVNGLDY